MRLSRIYVASLLIKGGRVLSPEDKLDGALDVLIEDGKIQQIAPRIAATADETLDARGQVVAPGLIDAHCHLRVPGGEISETLETGLAAAVAGGFTTVCAMPNTRPVNDRAESTRKLIEDCGRLGLARVFPIAAVSMASEGEALTDFAAIVTAGAVAFSDDGRPVKSAELMRAALEKARPLGAPIIDHCETPSLSAGGWMNEGEVARRLGARGIPNRSEDECVARDIEAAQATGGHVHIAHLSTAGAVEMVRKAKRRGLRVTCEVTPHHFSLTDEAVDKYGTHAKMNPPLRSRDDLQAVLGGIADGTVDVLATDHAPHAPELKAKPLAEAPFGIIGFETALPLALTKLVHTGKISLAHLIVMMSSNPAHLIRRPLGRLQAGGAADVTVFDPAREWTYHVRESRSKSRNSPFDGWKLKGMATSTIVAGRIVYRKN
jgi:dihydroorotase